MSDTFPQPAGETLVMHRKTKSQTQSSQIVIDEGAKLQPAPEKSAFLDQMADMSILRPMERGAPGDRALIAMVQRGDAEKQLSRKRSQFYGEVFAVREGGGSARERVAKDSMVMAEVRTNVIVGFTQNQRTVENEFAFVTGFSNQLSTRYQRPETSILIDVTHSACMMLAGSFEPTYILTITALPANIQPATNKRNTALLQHWMAENLGVEPSRGIVKFAAIPEENLATNGVTVLGEIEALDKQLGFDNVSGLKRTLTRGRAGSKGKKNSDSSSVTSPTSPPPPFAPIRMTPSPQLSSVSEDETVPPLPSVRSNKSKRDRRAEKSQRIGRRRSIIEFFVKQK
ncbi:hypothetical protein GP486_008323 [Trichoglossum hirsutum]|uniref:L-dopachrome isomerase n=1 Tax=Trichoglossum hirsutum TaxID=265104 RepID=A0A9P8L762_9PEZI|nr:hypothetical protein GP486_008323 [Trichoglossum hirsutum]